MEENNQAEFELQVSIVDATDEELDRFTRQLLSEIKTLDVESAELTRGGVAPQGSKGDPITLGTIAIKAIPTAIPGVFALVQSWMTRGQERTIKFKYDGLEYEGSREDLEKILDRIEKGKKKK